jgi:hypothetical protein
VIRRLFLLLIIAGLCWPQLASAQFGRWSEDGDTDLESLIRSGKFRPFLEVNYGLATPRFADLAADFATLGLVELKLGYAELDSVRAALVSLDERYAFVSYLDEGLGTSSPEQGEVSSQLTRFGLGNRLGYGFGGKGLSFQMFNQNSLNWTQVLPVDHHKMTPEAQAIFNRYENSYRFGQLMDAGFKIHVARRVAFTADVEGAVIFPRHVFWPWLGSAMIYSGIQGGLQFFSEQIIDTSPVIGPILHFLLKTGASLGYYLALREDMAWPFGYETPLTVESFKLGAALTF